MIIGRTANITEPFRAEPIASTAINAGWDARLAPISAHSLLPCLQLWQQVI